MSARQIFQNVLVRTYSELESIPGFSPEVDLSNDQFVDVLSHYNFEIECQCSLKNCHQWHKDGYLCEFESGTVGNVGHQCAHKYIGPSFGEMLNRYQRERALPRLKTELALVAAQLPSWRAELLRLKGEIEGLVELKRRFPTNFPEIWRALSASQLGSEFVVHHSKEVEVVDKLENGETRVRTELQTERKGAIAGIRILRENVWPVVAEIERIMDALGEFKVMPEHDWHKLSKLTSESGRLANHFQFVRSYASDAKLFFAADNERLVTQLQGSARLEAEAKRFSFQAAKEFVPRTPPTQTSSQSPKNRKERRQAMFQNDFARFGKH